MIRIVIVMSILLATCGPALAADPGFADNALVSLRLPGFFAFGNRARSAPEGAQMKVYLIRRDGKWVAGVGNSNSDNGKPSYNTALFPVDTSGLTLADNKLGGKIVVALPADPWVPTDHKVHIAHVTLDAALAPAAGGGAEKASITGTWKSTVEGDARELTASAGLASSSEGKLMGSVAATAPNDISNASYDLAMYGLIPGPGKDEAARRRALSLGVKDGAIVSARLGQMDIRHNAYDYQPLETPAGFTVTGDAISGTLSFSANTLDADPATFTISLEGQRLINWVVGTWKGKYVVGGKESEISGYFRGDVRKGAFVAATGPRDDRPWFVPVAGFTPLAPGEHPRLFFRKSDVAELKRRAETADGQRIIKRLRQCLNGSDGESMPTRYNPANRAYAGNFRGGPGSYTIYHGAGFGFLYQLTGDKKYADLARQCVEKAFAGQRDADDRYAWVAPGGELRAGPSVGWTAVAYDLCYEAWPEDFRTKVALAVQNYADEKGGEWNTPEGITLRKMSLTPKMGPASNHFGAVVGGAGLAVLAIKGDPGTDDALLTKYAESLEKQVPRSLSAGWGDGGYYKEGWGPANVGHQMGFLNFVQALRVATGHDYANGPRANLANTLLVPYCLMLLGPPATFPYRSDMPANYGGPDFGAERGWYPHFCDGFGVLTDKQKAAYLWSYQHIVQPNRGNHDFDAVGGSPHRPMLALINWPTLGGIAEKNPAEAIPHWSRDSLYDYFVFRNRWQDSSDIVTTVGLNLPQGSKPREVMVWGLGQKLSFTEPKMGAKVTHFAPGKDGSATLTAGDFALAVDYSGASGADALVVCVGPAPRDAKDTGKVRFATVKADRTTYQVLTLSSSGTQPEIKVAGDALTIGDQSVSFADGKLTLAKFAVGER